MDLSDRIEFGKVDLGSVYPPQYKGQAGADEMTAQALTEGLSPEDILHKSLIKGMERVGIKFRESRIFLPEVLMAAKAMKAAMTHLKPHFQSGKIKKRGTFVVGTVTGDLHDIGKNLVAMIVEGSGWHVVDLGVDVSYDSYVEAIRENPGCCVGLSALLTTTMKNMEEIIGEIKQTFPQTRILVGGAPLNDSFRISSGADFYAPDPQGAVDYLNSL